MNVRAVASSMACCLGCLVCCVPGAWAQGTITDAPATFVRGTSPFDISPDANFTGVSATLAQDHLFEVGWWYRVAGDTQENVLGAPTTQNYTGNTSTLEWTDVGTRGLFSAQETSTVFNLDPGGAPQGEVLMTLRIANLSASDPLTIDVFNMVDFDVQPTAGNDSAVLLPDGMHLRITDPGGNFAEYAAPEAGAYLVRPFGATDLGSVLGNASVDNFDNSGLPFGPGDFTGGMQWAGVTIPPSGSHTFSVMLLVNAQAAPLDRIFQDGFDHVILSAAP